MDREHDFLATAPFILPELPARRSFKGKGARSCARSFSSLPCSPAERARTRSRLRQMRMQLDQQKSWNSGGVAATAGGAPAATPAPSSAPSSYTTTNTQVAGVDEADFVKNDGTRIFVLSGHRLFSATSWPAESLAVKGKLDIEGWPSEMFLDGNQIAVFSSIWTMQPVSPNLCAL
ncbi:MAG: hypothetical protein E6J88_19305, partial [Deltaproteobacteria bacterium]